MAKRKYLRVKPLRTSEQKCKCCSQRMMVYPSRIRKGQGKFCSRECFSRWRIGKPHPNDRRTMTEKEKAVRRKLMSNYPHPFKGKRHSEESRRKMSDARKGVFPADYYRKIGLKGTVALSKRRPTSIELVVYDELKRRGFIFETQKIVGGKFVVDAYIPELNLIIECDGNYWHSLDRVKKKDKAENRYLEKCGYKVLRLKEDEINDGSFTERMVS